MPILTLNPLVAAAGSTLETVAAVDSFNSMFNLVVTMAVYLLPAVAAIRLVQRS